MTRTFTYTFEELPLTVVDCFQAGLMSGSAEISYDHGGGWHISDVSLDGHRKAFYPLEMRVEAELQKKPLPPYEYRAVSLDRNAPLYWLLVEALRTRRHDEVQEAVRERINQDLDDR